MSILPRPSALLVLAIPLAPSAGAQETLCLSKSSGGVQANLESLFPSISRDGNLVAFESESSNLVPGDTNGVTDIFLHDRSAGTTVRVSVGSAGQEANNRSVEASVAADAGLVAFRSLATNLYPGAPDPTDSIFVHDLASGLTTHEMETLSGDEADEPCSQPSLSADGSTLAFASWATNLAPVSNYPRTNIFLRDRTTGTFTCITPNGNHSSFGPAVSGDGRYVAFSSVADNLVPDDTNATRDIFLYDAVSESLIRVSVDSNGVEANGQCGYSPAISLDGGTVVYPSQATNLVVGDTNGTLDIFAYDVATKTTTRVTLADGSEPNGTCNSPTVSADGRYIAFMSNAPNLLPPGSSGGDIIVHDRVLGTNHPVSISTGFAVGNGVSQVATICGDGGSVAFISFATNLGQGADANGSVRDIYVRDIFRAASQTYGTGHPGTLGVPSISLSAPPVMGTDVDVVVENSAGMPTVGLLFVGTAPASLLTPWDGTLHVLSDLAVLAAAMPGATHAFPWSMPKALSFEGFPVYLQMLQVDAGASVGLSFTPGLEVTIGW